MAAIVLAIVLGRFGISRNVFQNLAKQKKTDIPILVTEARKSSEPW